MEAVDQIQLPPVIQNENIEQPSDNPEISATNNLPAINTDNLPITPLRSKRWLNNGPTTPDTQKAKFSLNLTPISKSPSTSATKLLDNEKSPSAESLNSSYNEFSNLNLPNTDNLLDINVPKTTLLGKEQAKKRLHAFSLSKQNNMNASPLSKKKNLKQPKFLLQPAEDKYNENGEKADEKFVLIKKPSRKSVNPNEKAKAVIEEIEEMKKIESAYLEALEQGLLDQRNRRSRSKSRSRERSKRHSSRKTHRRSRSVETKSRKSWDKPRYPTSWAEVNSKGYDMETLAAMKQKEHKNKDNEPIDFRKLLLYQTPSQSVHRLTIKGLNGKEKTIPPEYIRFTNKSPRISYSTKEKMPNDFYLRKCVLQYVPKSFREGIKNITNNSILAIDLEASAKPASRKWFPQTVLSKVEDNTECKILETSLGLSFLQTYSDGDEQEKEINEGDLTNRKFEEDVNQIEKIDKIERELDEKTELKVEVVSDNNEELRPKVAVIDTEEEVEEKAKKRVQEKKRKRKEKKKEKSKPKKEKGKKKKKIKVKRGNKCEKVTKRRNSTLDDDKKKQHKENDNKKIDDNHKTKTEADESRKGKRNRSKSNDPKDKSSGVSKEEKSDKTKNRKRSNSDGADKSIKETQRKNEPDLNKTDHLIKKESRKNREKEKRIGSPKRSSERIKTEGKRKSRSTSRERKSKKHEKVNKSKSPKNAKETRKVKCVAEKEFGTPDTEEYYSNWESDVELSANLEKPPTGHNESASMNQSWQSDEDPLEISDITISDIPLVKSPFKDEQSSPIVLQQQNKDKSEAKRTYKRDKSVEKRRSSLRDRSSSPLRVTRSRHLDDFSVELSPIPNVFSPKHSIIELPPPPNDFSPFRNRIEERRRSRRSMDRSPPEKFLQMPLNIRNTRNSYSRKQWEEERFDGSKYSRSPNPVEFDDNKMYALYADNPWERDDYLTIKTEELRLEEERRTLIEERRKLEIERRKFEEMERQRYYNRMTEFDEKRCGFEERNQEEFKVSDDEDKRYRAHRDYREMREHPQYPKENDTALSRRSSDDQRSRRRYTPERSLELPKERARDSFNWEDAVENKRSEKYMDKLPEQEANKRRRKSRWQNIDDLEPLRHEQYIPVEQEAPHGKNDSMKNEIKPEQKCYGKEKKTIRKNRWESSEDELDVRDDKKSNEKIQSKQEQHKKSKDTKYKEKRDKECTSVVSREKHKRAPKREEENKERSLTDNLDIPPRKPLSRTSAQKPEVLENEYEKFMQALGSEISTAEEISEKDFEQQRRKTKLGDKRIKKRKSFSRSVSMSSDEEFEKKSREVRKRKTKKRVSSSSSSSTSSSSSWSDSSTDSSSMSSSSEFSSEEEKRRKLKKRKMDAAKVANTETHHKQKKMVESKLKSKYLDVSNFDVSSTSHTKEKEMKEGIKIENSEEAHNSKSRLTTLSDSPNIGANLNIINLTIQEFSLGEIPLPNLETSRLALKASDVPLPVPSPKVSLIASSNDPVLQIIDPVVAKIESVVPPVPKTELTTEENLATPVLSDIAPVSPVTPTFPSNILELKMNDLNTPFNMCAIKEEPTTPEENKFSGNSAVTDAPISPTKRNNLIPIKFLTAEVRKQANDSPHLKLLGTIETKDSLIPGNQMLATDVKMLAAMEKNDSIEALPLTNCKRHFAMSSINLPAKRPLLDGSENDENSTDFTDKFFRKDESMEEVSTSNAQLLETLESSGSASHRQSLKSCEKSFETDRIGREPSRDRRKYRGSLSPRRKRDLSPRSNRRDSRSPRRHDSSRRWSKDVSPRRREREMSPRGQRMMSPGRWDRNVSPRRASKDTLTRRSRDDFHRRNSSASPGQREGRRDQRSISPATKKRASPRHRSPSLKRRSMSREVSPRMHRSKDRSPSKDRKLESIQETLQRIAGVSKYSNRMKRSPISSPLHGFKRSVADSTISDDQLLQHNAEEYTESQAFNAACFKNSVSHSPSPKRMSLDERISQALGLADQQPKPISTTYSNNYQCDPQYFDQYGQYYEQYGEQDQKSGMYGQSTQCYRQSRQRENSNLTVVQVGNVLQVVPTEDVPPKQSPVQQNMVTNSTQKIVQVGNMLQIVPTATLPELPIEPASVPLPSSAPSTPPPTTNSVKDPLNAEVLIKQKAERRAEKDKRRQEREKKRKEKEKKRKEREKRKQLKVKMQTEAMIKQALIQETEEAAVGNEENLNLENTGECQTQVQWPPVPQIVCNSSYKPAGKGILSQGSRASLNEGGETKRKTVTFSDGVMPGEGTSPSGGEELSSPPPAPKKLPKEKRFIKTKVPKKVKVPKKKKVKVKVIRQQQTQGTEDDDEEEDDNLPPPPPPPGSPPPHIFPARVKHPVINNIHPSIVVSIANPPLQPTNTSYPPPSVYRPPQPPVIMPHHGHHHHHGPPHLPPMGPHHGHHHHPPPCPPPHHGGFNPPTVVIPPVISVVPSPPHFHPSHHHGGHNNHGGHNHHGGHTHHGGAGHHHHGGAGHHHHHSPNHHGHHHH